MRYEFGIMDYVQLLITNTSIGCVPHFSVYLKENVVLDKLKSALISSLKKHPIFATKLVYDKKYYLEDNNAELVILETKDAKNNFGKTTNGYLWRVTYDNNIINFDFSHGITDGRGMARFITTVLEFYYDLPVTYETEKYICGFESVYDKTVSPIGLKEQEKGFTSFDLPHTKNGSPTSLTYLSLNTLELLNVAKKTDSSPAAILLPLFSRAVYQSLPKDAKRKNVAGYFTADFRKVMNLECGRNFIGYKYNTYTKNYENMSLETLATVYRGIMDLFLQPENVIDFCTKFKDDNSFLERLKPMWLTKALLKIAAPIEKKKTNIYLTYIGKLPFSKELCELIDDVKFVVYPDTGYCVMSALDFNGTLKLSVTNNYKTDAIIPSLIKVFEENQIHVECSETTKFSQAKMV